MRERDSNTKSPWQEIALNLQANNTAVEAGMFDVLIVGGGITGMTAALLLQKAGKKCLLAEAKTMGFGTTGGTTAHLNTFYDTSYADIEKDFGEEAAQLMAAAGTETLSMIKKLIDDYGIDCDFEFKDAYLYAEDEQQSKDLVSILAASRKAGVNAVETRENKVPVPFQLAAMFPEQAQFHPLKYLLQLSKVFKEAGGVILENTFIRKTTYRDGVHHAESDHHRIKALNLVYATHLPPGINVLDFRCAPYRSYVVGLKLKNDDYPDALVYDMQEPYHYFRTHVIDGQKYLILGGEDHKTGHGDSEMSFEKLIAYAKKYYYVEDIAYQWSAQFYVSADGLPYIGRLPGGDDQTYVASGYNGNGMIFGSLAGSIIADQILGVHNVYADLLRPSRIKPIAGFEEFVAENADVAFHFIADRLSVSALTSLKDLAPGTGEIVKYKDHKLALYKDQDGKVTALNPTCTHAKCIVKFNSAEKSWDCPCHGGRFTVLGEVLTGPPRKNLDRIELSDL